MHQGGRHLRRLDESVGVGGAEGPATCSGHWGQTGADGNDIDDDFEVTIMMTSIMGMTMMMNGERESYSFDTLEAVQN